MNENYNVIIELLDRPIAFNPAFAKILDNDLNAGMLLSQLFYWAKSMKFEEFYKTSEELQNECFLGRDAFERARKKIASAEIFDFKTKGLPRKTFYQINMDRLVELLNTLVESPQAKMLETSIMKCSKPAIYNAGNQQTLINNIEYTKNNTNIKKKPSFLYDTTKFSQDENIAIREWLEHKKPKTQLQVDKIILNMAKINDIVEAVNNSIGAGYKKLVDPTQPNTLYQKPILERKELVTTDAQGNHYIDGYIVL